jgi:hypothetical protein
MLEIALLLWLAMVIGTAALAHKKGRNVLAWIAIGWVLGVFGLLWIWSLEPIQQPKPISAATSQGRTCPFCAETVKSAAIVCKHCGRDLPPDPAVATAADMDGQFDQWLAAQSPPLTNVSGAERESYRQAWEYQRSQATAKS